MEITENQQNQSKSVKNGKFRAKTPTLSRGWDQKVQNVFYPLAREGILTLLFGYFHCFWPFWVISRFLNTGFLAKSLGKTWDHF